jgi:hypothetical protein
VEVTIPISVKSIGDGAFLECSALVEATINLISVESIGRDAFDRCHADLVLNLGAVADIGTPNHFLAINGVARCATLVHQLPGSASCCTVRRVWPASMECAYRENGRLRFAGRPPKIGYKPTEPGPAALVDGSRIVEPLQLQTLAGDEYMVHGCWGKDPVAHPDFKRLAAEQHPDALGNAGSWEVLLHTTDVATATLDLAELGDMLVRGELDLDEPVLVVWTDDAAANDVAERSTKRQRTAAVEDV